MAEFSMDSIFRREKVEQKGFFQSEIKRYPTPVAAIAAIVEGEADCLLIDANSWYRLQRGQPGLANQMVTLRNGHGPVLPNAVFVARPQDIQRVRLGLWKELQSQLTKVHDTAEGKQCMTFWRVQRFDRPDKQFEDLVDRTGEEFDRFFRQAGSDAK